MSSAAVLKPQRGLKNLRILALGGCQLQTPLNNVGGARSGLARVSIAGPRFIVLTLGEMRQLYLWMTGESAIAPELRRFCNIPSDFALPDASVLRNIDAALIEINTSYELVYNQHYLNRIALTRIFAEIGGADGVAADLFGRWMEATLKLSDIGAQTEVAKALDGRLPASLPDRSELVSILFEARGKLSNLEQDLADVAALIPAPVGVVGFTRRYGPDGEATSWPEGFSDEMSAASRAVGVDYFDPRPMVASAGVTAVIKEDMAHYTGPFKPVVGRALIEFALKVSEREGSPGRGRDIDPTQKPPPAPTPQKGLRSMNASNRKVRAEPVRAIRILALGGRTLNGPLISVRGDRSGVAKIAIASAGLTTVSLGQAKQVVRILKGEISDPETLRLCNLPADFTPGNILNHVNAVLLEPGTNHEIVYRGVFRNRLEIMRYVMRLSRIDKTLGERGGVWWRDGIVKCDDDARTSMAMEIVKHLPAGAPDRAELISVFCETHGKLADVKKDLAELLDMLPARAGIVSCVSRYRADGGPVNWQRSFFKEVRVAADALNVPYLDTRPIVTGAGLDKALKSDMSSYQPEFLPIIGKKLAEFAQSFATPVRRGAAKLKLVPSAGAAAPAERAAPFVKPPPGNALANDLHILTFGGCLLHGPLSRIAREKRAPDCQITFAGPPFIILTLGEMRQMCRILAGELPIEESLRDLCRLPPDFNPPRDGSALHGINVALVEPNTSYEITYGGYFINRFGLFRYLEPFRALDKKVNSLVGSWLQAGVCNGDVEAQQKLAQDILSQLPSDLPGIDRLRSVLLETRGRISDLENDMRELASLIGVPVGIVSFTWRYMADGRALSWPAQFHSDIKETAHKLGLGYFDSRPLVLEAGVETGLATDLRHYHNDFKGVIGGAMAEFARGIAAPMTERSTIGRSVVTLVDEDVEEM